MAMAYSVNLLPAVSCKTLKTRCERVERFRYLRSTFTALLRNLSS